MRETKFIDQNKKDWAELENTLDSTRRDPDRLSDLFIKITDNLSYSRTFYPNRSVRVYLNGLAQRIFASIYRSRRHSSDKFVTFWTEDLPDVLWDSRKELLVSLVLFLLAVGIGIISSIHEPEFARSILGDQYVDMTIANIDSGDPMNVYKDEDILGMWLGITMNNILVALRTFAMGILFAVGTIFILLYNGIMVGAFQYFFVEFGLFRESFLTIFMHGAAELSAIAIAGGAGLTMGRGLVFPGTYSRVKAFQLSARRGIKIMLAVIVMLIFAGFVEAFVTRMTYMPDLLRALFIFGCFRFIAFYFGFYPWYRHRAGLKSSEDDDRVSVDRAYALNYQEIKSTGSILTETFVLWRRGLTKYLPWIGLATALHTFVLFFATSKTIPEVMIYGSTVVGFFEAIPRVFSGWIPLVAGSLGFAMLSARIFGGELDDHFTEIKAQKFWLPKIPLVLVVGFALAGILSISGSGIFLLTTFLFLPTLLWLTSGVLGSKNFFSAIGRGLKIFQLQFSNALGVSVILFILSFVGFVAISTEFFQQFARFIAANFYLENDALNNGMTVALTFVLLFLIYFLFPLWLLAAKLMYFSGLEKLEANGLHDYIEKIGADQRIRGMLRE